MKNLVCAVALAAISCGSAGAAPAAKNVVLTAAVTRTRLPVPAGALRAKTELVLRNIRFDEHPGMQFHVVLERRDDRTKRARAGTLNFYATAKTSSRTFDVTDELRELAASSADLGKIDLVFEATTGRGGADAGANVGSGMKVTVGEIELRLKK